MTDRDDYYDDDSDEYVFPEDKEDWQSSDYEMMTRDPEDPDEEWYEEDDEAEHWEEMALREEPEEPEEPDYEGFDYLINDEDHFAPSCVQCLLKHAYWNGVAAVDSPEAVECIEWLLASEYSRPVESIADGPGNPSLFCDVCRYGDGGLQDVGQWRLVRDGQLMTRQLYPNGPVATVGVVSWLMCRGFVDRRIGANFVALFPTGCQSIPPQSVVVLPMANIAEMAGKRRDADAAQDLSDQSEWNALIAALEGIPAPQSSSGAVRPDESDDIPF